MRITFDCPCCGKEIDLQWIDFENCEVAAVPAATSTNEEASENGFKIIAIMGPSGSGKTTLLEKVMSNDKNRNQLNKIIATTTRPKRDNENEDAYYFVSNDTFSLLHNRMIEQTQFRDWHYGTDMFYLDDEKWNIGIFSPEAINQLADSPLVSELRVIYLWVDEKIRVKRALSRENNPDIKEILRRLVADERDFNEENFAFERERFLFYDDKDLKLVIQEIEDLVYGQE